MKIFICKHSAARTAVEQAADCSPVFKLLRKLIKEMDNLHEGQSVLVHRISTILDLLEAGDQNGKNKIKLASHKKKAIISTVGKLPIAMGKVFQKRM